MTQAVLRASRLVARTTALAPCDVPDLLAVAGDGGMLWEHDGAGLAGRGVAVRIELPRGLADAPMVAAVLGAIEVDDGVSQPGSGPVAIGALPFDPAAPGALVVPRVTVRRTANAAWMTVVSADEYDVGAARIIERAAATTSAAGHTSAPDEFRLVASPPHAEWLGLLEAAIGAVTRGSFAKLVVAREVLVEANRAISPSRVLERLRALFPSCVAFAAGGFVGASPELLVRRTGAEFVSHPLAGTCGRSGDHDVDAAAAAALLASGKERLEHSLVVDAIAAGLRPDCAALAVPEAPDVVPLRNVLHLGTRIAGRLREPPPTALELAARLHPTPAVAGTPTQDALEWLARNELVARGRYAGPVGWVDARGDGAFAVGIRSAELAGPTARLFAGVGIVPGSVPEAELAESQLKLQALLAAVVRP